ncbi:ExbD/TolR family protein [Paracoccus marinaquae]|uniref:Biopolymer transporter ExbD n=1 Tax=Paracoccus marinaquae TaxID=2841926 RepID=A0ABS6AIH5_9RHOB|nr:biopolymer transporter ExbD [Paracoccus marinaquae]MBU3030011.1 biopolymer transporter ExbD [Paracoccus marinaquae]
MSETGFSFGPRRHPRRMSLTPMIDVVFLLLIFFMLSSRFGIDAVLPIAGGSEGTGSEWQGAPRLVDIAADGLMLNGAAVEEEALADALTPLMPPEGGAVVLRPREGADLQRLVEVMDLLRADGFDRLILVE